MSEPGFYPNGIAHLMPRIKVAHVTHDGATAIIPAVELMQLLEDGGSYMVRLSDMMQREFDLLPEFG